MKKNLIGIFVIGLCSLTYVALTNSDRNASTEKEPKIVGATSLMKEVAIQKEEAKAIQKRVAKLEDNSLFAEVKDLQGKVVLTEEEKKRIEDFYQSSEKLSHAYNALNVMNFESERHLVKRRIQAVNYIVRVLEMKGNQIQDQALELVSHFLNSERYSRLKSKEHKKLVLGDKLDLAMVLMQHHRDFYYKIKKTVLTTKNAKLLKFAEVMYKNNKGPKYETL